MSSWPGFSRPHSELVSEFIPCSVVSSHHQGITLQALFAEDLWPDHRSEIYVPKCPSIGSSFDQGNGVYKGAILLSSTGSGTLQSISPLPSEPSLPRTTSTAPVYGVKTTEEKGGCDDVASISRPLIKDQQRGRLPSSPQHSCFGDHAAASARDNSAKLTNLLDEVVNLHEEVSTKRYRARDLRHTLRQKREEEHDLRMALRNALNLVSPDSVHNEALAISNAIEDLQTATNAYLVLQEEYHRFEDELGEQEYLLEKRMRRLNASLRKRIPSLTRPDRDIDPDLDSSSDYASDDEIDISPNEAEYLSLVGDVRMLRERLAELEGEYLALIDQRKLRERMGISLDAEALAFLDSYEDEKAQIETELDLALRRVQTHPEHTKEPTPAALDAQWQEVLEAYLPEPPEDQPPPDRLCISEFDDRSPFFESARPFSIDKAAFINKWLLHRLRHSRMEVLRLKSQPALTDLIHQGWDADTISQMALMLWFRDETAQMVRLGSNSAG